MNTEAHLSNSFQASYGPSGWVVDTPYFPLEDELLNDTLRYHIQSTRPPETIVRDYINRECTITLPLLASKLGEDICARIMAFTFWKVHVRFQPYTMLDQRIREVPVWASMTVYDLLKVLEEIYAYPARQIYINERKYDTTHYQLLADPERVVSSYSLDEESWLHLNVRKHYWPHPQPKPWQGTRAFVMPWYRNVMGWCLQCKQAGPCTLQCFFCKGYYRPCCLDKDAVNQYSFRKPFNTTILAALCRHSRSHPADVALNKFARSYIRGWTKLYVLDLGTLRQYVNMLGLTPRETESISLGIYQGTIRYHDIPTFYVILSEEAWDESS